MSDDATRRYAIDQALRYAEAEFEAKLQRIADYMQCAPRNVLTSLRSSNVPIRDVGLWPTLPPRNLGDTELVEWALQHIPKPEA